MRAGVKPCDLMNDNIYVGKSPHTATRNPGLVCVIYSKYSHTLHRNAAFQKRVYIIVSVVSVLTIEKFIKKHSIYNSVDVC